MYNVNCFEALLYVIAFALIIGAALLIYEGQLWGGKKTVFRLRLMQQVKERAGKLSGVFYNENLEKLLVSCGRPLSLNSARYNMARYSVIGAWLMYINVWWVVYRGRYPLNTVSLVLAIFVVTCPAKGFPIVYLLEKLRDFRLRGKNKECFTLYSMIQNEFYTDSERPLNMYSILNKLKPYFKSIDKALGKAILLWRRSPAKALDAFASEVGTEEAHDLAQILKNVDASAPQDARDILDSRYEQFVAKRHENHKRYRNNVGLVGYIAALFPVFAVIYNAMVIFNLEKQELLKFITQR